MIFLAALAVLLFNDWVAKGRSFLPGALTGKLSDIAGLVVAPVVLAWLLRALRVRRSSTAIASFLVVGGFATLKLSQVAADRSSQAMSELARAVGLPNAASVVRDPSDLVALPLALLGAWVANRLATDRTLLRAGGMAIGLLACTATSYSQFRVTPHWGFDDDRLLSTWAGRVEEGVVMLRMGPNLPDGTFALDVQLNANGQAMEVDLAGIRLETEAGILAAEIPAGRNRLLTAPAGASAASRIVLHSDRSTPRAGMRGRLMIPLQRGGRPHQLEVPFGFKERFLPWREADRRFPGP